MVSTVLQTCTVILPHLELSLAKWVASHLQNSWLSQMVWSSIHLGTDPDSKQGVFKAPLGPENMQMNMASIWESPHNPWSGEMWAYGKRQCSHRIQANIGKFLLLEKCWQLHTLSSGLCRYPLQLSNSSVAMGSWELGDNQQILIVISQAMDIFHLICLAYIHTTLGILWKMFLVTLALIGWSLT